MPSSPNPAASVDALREHFGDGRPPEISRKVTACVACRKQKIKCHMKNSKAPCVRCKKRNLPCTVNRSLQMLLEEDTLDRSAMKGKIRSLEEAIGLLANKLSMPELTELIKEPQEMNNFPVDKTIPRQMQAPILSPSSHALPSWELVMDSESGPAGIPASVVCTIPPTRPPPLLPSGDSSNVDLIARGIVSLENAESFYRVYSARLDDFVYRILIHHNSLSSIRASSPLLTAAVCTVGALHISSPEYEACYKEFVRLGAAQVFSKNHTVDDVRALCIGAFWLSDISWTLVGLAVRIATEIQLHRCISKMPHEKIDCYRRTRIWFLVYICDHHFSIAYGKPPMTHEFETLNRAATFLESPHATEDDARLIGEVEIWTTSTDVFKTFGVDANAPLSDRALPQLRRFSIALDTWRANWTERFTRNCNVGDYPRKSVGLHFHFAKLYLCSHVFRGSIKAAEILPETSSDINEFATSAIFAAVSILRIIVSDTEIQTHLNGLPLYFDTMIAFAVVFLLKLTMREPGIVRVDRQEIVGLVGQLVDVLNNLKPHLHQQHLLFSIAISVEKLLSRCLKPASQEATFLLPPHGHPESMTSGSVQEWTANSSEAFLMGNYDFLSSQALFNGFEFDLSIYGFDQMQQ